MKKTILYGFEVEPNIIGVVKKSFWKANRYMDDHIDGYITDILRDNNFFEIEEGIYEYVPKIKPDDMTLTEYFSKSEEEQRDIKEKYRLHKPLDFKEVLKKLEEHGFKYSQELTDFLKECRE